MLTLLSDKEINQLHAHLTEMTSAIENLTYILGGAQTVSIEVDQPVRTPAVRQKAVRVSDTPKSQRKTHESSRKRGRRALNAEQVAHIKGALQRGQTALALARAYKVHPTTINCIKWGKTWKAVAPLATGGVPA
jgi:hypothetical protein